MDEMIEAGDVCSVKPASVKAALLRRATMPVKSIPVGTKFGRLTVIGIGELFRSSSGKNRSTSVVECECGTVKTITNNNLLSITGIKSCGCVGKEKSARQLRERATHGMSHTSEYKIWIGINQRCSNTNGRDYKRHYGVRGITVCDRWKNSFEAFFEDMGARPSKDHSIDRIDNDSGYCKENCRWATTVEQANNKRVNRRFTFYGKELTVAQWSRITQVPDTLIGKRLLAGWPEKEAFWTQSGTRTEGYRNSSNGRWFTFYGKTLRISEWSRISQVRVAVIWNRISLGWTIKEAFWTQLKR